MRRGSVIRRLAPFVIPAAEMLFQPNIEANEQVTTAHLLDLELRFAGAAITPRYGYARPFVASNNRFQGYLDRQVEMGRDQRPAPIDRRSPVGFESIGNVVVFDSKQNSQKGVGETVQEKFQPRIIDDSAPFHKAASEHAVVTGVQ